MTPEWAQKFDDTEWPVLGREELFAQCLSFLAPDDITVASRQLDIAGPSGIGKSFFTKELICRFAGHATHAICLYLNVEQSEFESAELEKQLLALYSHPHMPTRKRPYNVPPDVVPRKLDLALRRNPNGWLWGNLFEEAMVRPVLLAIDNVQFLPDAVRGELERVLPAAATGLRFIAVERLHTNSRTTRAELTCFPEAREIVELDALSFPLTRQLVHDVLGDDEAADETSRKLYATSQGNPKQLWIQLRALELKRNSQSSHVTVGDYEETIRDLPALEIMALRIVTFLEGGLRLDDLVQALRSMIEPLENAEEKIRNTVAALAMIGLLIINGTAHDRVRTEHELVKLSVNQVTSPQERFALRQPTIDALMARLRQYTGDDEEYERLIDRLVGLLTPVEMRERSDYRAHLIRLIERQYNKENYRYLTLLYPEWEELGMLLPRDCLLAFLDAFQKTSQFDEGIAAVGKMRTQRSTLSRDELAVAEAKYLVQKFDYGGALRLLEGVKAGSESALLRFNIHLNRCEDDIARSIVEDLPADSRKLDEFQCVMLRNANHLYDADTARGLLERARERFEQLGRNLGVASTMTNRGVVEMWDGNREAARRHLTEAQRRLEAIGSNEAYQPLTNLAVLCALEERYDDALELLTKAEMTVSRRQLAMDNLMLRFDRLVIEMIAGGVPLIEAAADAAQIHQLSMRDTLDYRFQETLGWFANELARATGGTPVASEFDRRFRDNGCTGLEIFKRTSVDRHELTAVFVLSPHWRY